MTELFGEELETVSSEKIERNGPMLNGFMQLRITKITNKEGLSYRDVCYFRDSNVLFLQIDSSKLCSIDNKTHNYFHQRLLNTTHIYPKHDNLINHNS